VLELPGERILLRDWFDDEVDAMHRWRGDPAVTRFLSWGSATREESAEHLAQCLEDQRAAERERFFFAVALRESGRVVGSAGMHYRSRTYGGGEGGLGYFLEPGVWGQGYAPEAASLIVDYGFGTLGMDKISASCDAGNTASERVMQKIGMRSEGRFRHAHMRAGEWRDRLWYGLLREEWQA
jgi:RimJ/RimL family protein N-acetyltransferase